MGWRESFRDIANRGVRLACLACGSDDLDIGHSRVLLVAIGEDNRVALDISPSAPGTGTGLVCAPILCNNCGFVSLHNLAPYEDRDADEASNRNQ
jgi:hypothetical protein